MVGRLSKSLTAAAVYKCYVVSVIFPPCQVSAFLNVIDLRLLHAKDCAFIEALPEIPSISTVRIELQPLKIEPIEVALEKLIAGECFRLMQFVNIPDISTLASVSIVPMLSRFWQPLNIYVELVHDFMLIFPTASIL